MTLINPYLPNAPFLYSLKTSENLAVFGCFQGLGKGCVENKWVNITQVKFSMSLFLLDEYGNTRLSMKTA